MQQSTGIGQTPEVGQQPRLVDRGLRQASRSCFAEALQRFIGQAGSRQHLAGPIERDLAIGGDGDGLIQQVAAARQISLDESYLRQPQPRAHGGRIVTHRFFEPASRCCAIAFEPGDFGQALSRRRVLADRSSGPR